MFGNTKAPWQDYRESADAPPEVEVVAPAASEDVEPAPELSGQERAEMREALDRFARCSSRKLVYDAAAGLYLPRQKKGCQ
jgi:hypothetical protein